MTSESRAEWLAGRFSNVDGIPFRMPIGTASSPVLLAAFTIDAGAAASLLPGQELFPCRILRRGLLVVTVVDYPDTTIGRYIELCLGILVTRGRRVAPPLLPTIMRSAFETGVYIYDLPVSTEVSVKGGLGIWGMPKRRASLDFLIGPDVVSSQYDLDGQVVMRIDVPRTSRALFPLVADSVGYGQFRGLLTKSCLHFQGRAGLQFRPAEGARLLLGDHPRMDPIKRLGIDPRPLFTGFVPSAAGVLDDHVETWFLTADGPPDPAEVGLEDVVKLGLSEMWLPPPNRESSDRLLRELSPEEAVRPRPAPSVARLTDSPS